MSIEREIKELREEMAALRAVLEAVQRDAAFYRDGGESVAEQEEPAEDADSVPEDTPKPEVVTRENLSQLCLSLIRSKKVGKKELLDIVAEYDGAQSVKQVEEAKLPELFARLKGME